VVKLDGNGWENGGVTDIDQPDLTQGPGFRSGFCAFVGRPNAGKSTLTNALVGSKIVITSDKPQTTRRAVRGVLNRPDGQLVIVDTPGLHRPRTLLGERLNDVVRNALSEVDVVGFCVPADQKIGPGDRFIAAELRELRAPRIAIVTKTDRASKQQIAQQLMTISTLGEFADIVPVSAVADDQVGLLADLLVANLPQGPRLYPSDVATDESNESRVAELIREAALADVRDELPHSIAVTIEEMNPREGAAPGAVQPEADHARRGGFAAERHRDEGAPRNRGTARPAGASRPAHRCHRGVAA
jgi:GTP-binding protein Era